MKNLLFIVFFLWASPCFGWWVVCDPPENDPDWSILKIEYELNGESFIHDWKGICETKQAGCIYTDPSFDITLVLIHEIEDPHIQSHRARYLGKNNEDGTEVWGDWAEPPNIVMNISMILSANDGLPPYEPPDDNPPVINTKWYGTTTFELHDLGEYSNIVDISFNVTSQNQNIDGVVGLFDSRTEPEKTYSGAAFYNDMFVLVLLNNGQYMVSDNNTFRSDSVVNFTQNNADSMRILVDFNTNTYDVFVNGIMIADNYAFRESAPYSDNVGQLSLPVWGSGMFFIEKFEISGN